jgi:hypothetical protein
MKEVYLQIINYTDDKKLYSLMNMKYEELLLKMRPQGPLYATVGSDKERDILDLLAVCIRCIGLGQYFTDGFR